MKILKTVLIDEVKNILKKGFSSSLNSLNTVGYKEIISYLNNERTLEDAVALIKRNTRRFAKRQLTWFRRDRRVKWIRVDANSDFKQIAFDIIKEIG